jgi:hypothetical protein
VSLADWLQTTATAIRAEYPDDRFHGAIAGWLDYAAREWGDTDPRFIGLGARVDQAIAVADAYRLEHMGGQLTLGNDETDQEPK